MTCAVAPCEGFALDSCPNFLLENQIVANRVGDHCSARLSGAAPDSACVPRRPAATDALKRLRPTVRSVTATATRYSSSHSGVVATLGDDIHPPAVCELFAGSVDDLLARVGVCAPHSLYGRQRVGAWPLTCGGTSIAIMSAGGDRAIPAVGTDRMPVVLELVEPAGSRRRRR